MEVRGQPVGSILSFRHLGVLGMEVRLPGLVTSAFTHRAISSAHISLFYFPSSHSGTGQRVTVYRGCTSGARDSLVSGVGGSLKFLPVSGSLLTTEKGTARVVLLSARAGILMAPGWMGQH